MRTDLKQVIVIRRDLKMRRGKEIAQGCHASMKATLQNMDDPRVKEWLSARFRKICVYVKSEEELLAVYQQALNAGLIAALIEDAGFTEFNGVVTKTAVGIGPDYPEKIDVVTGNLPLY